MTRDELLQTIKEHKAKGKRAHRKTHGKISFRELARTIASRWKKLDKNDKDLLEQAALLEKEEHAVLIKEWNSRQERRAPPQTKEPAVVVQPEHAECASTNTVLTDLLSFPTPINESNQANLQALIQARAQIQTEMQRLAQQTASVARQVVAVVPPSPCLEPEPLPAFYAPVEVNESFSRNFFDDDDLDLEAICEPNPIPDNSMPTQQSSVYTLFQGMSTAPPADPNVFSWE